METLFRLDNFTPNGGQGSNRHISTTYTRVPHSLPLLPEEPLPPLELLPKYQGWVIANDEQHIIEDVTPAMLDWFWANIEKGYVLWALGDHKWMQWIDPPSQVGFVGSSSVGLSQFMPGGPVGGVKITRKGMDDYPFTTCLEHCLVEHSLIGDAITEDRCDGMGIEAFFIASWSPHAKGSLWRSTVVVQPMGMKIQELWDESDRPDSPPPQGAMPPMGDAPAQQDDLHGQAAHGIYEVAQFSQFLPDLYKIWKVVDDPGVNVPNDLRVTKRRNGDWAYLNPYKPA